MEFYKADLAYTAPNDMTLVNFGAEDCPPGHSFGPAIRDYYLIHLVSSGKGTFKIHNCEFTVNAGELFLIPPGIATFYQASFSEPWSYTWVGMRGIMVPTYIENCGISDKNPILKYSTKLLDISRKIVSETGNVSHKSPLITGYLYLFFDELIKCGGQENDYKSNSQIYVENAVNYIHNNLYRKISISELSQYIGIDRSYLCSIFKGLIGCSPQAYILNAKIDMAKRLLSTTNNGIKDIASSLGYYDQLNFSHAFKTKTNMSPRAWRENYKN